MLYTTDNTRKGCMYATRETALYECQSMQSGRIYVTVSVTGLFNGNTDNRDVGGISTSLYILLVELLVPKL